MSHLLIYQSPACFVSDPLTITDIDMLNSLQTLTENTLDRIDNADAPYQMVGAMGDGIVFECPRGSNGRVDEISAAYLEDVPVAYFNTLYGNHSRILWTYGYSGQRRSLSQSIIGGTLFEVHMWNFQGACDPPFNEMSMDDNRSMGCESYEFSNKNDALCNKSEELRVKNTRNFVVKTRILH